MSAIEVSGLKKSYGAREVLHGVSFRVEAGEVFALLGPNGAGKTTTVEILEGYRGREGGTVQVLGTDPARAGSDFRARIGIVLQSSAVYPLLSVREILELFAGYYERARDVGEVIELVGLGEKRETRVRTLSGDSCAASTLRSRSSGIRSSSSWTNRRPASIRPRAARPGRPSATCGRSARASS